MVELLQLIGCKLFGHKWFLLKEESKITPVVCLRCKANGMARYSAWRAQWDLIG